MDSPSEKIASGPPPIREPQKAIEREFDEVRQDNRRWRATVIGLKMIFWSMSIIGVLAVLLPRVRAMGDDDGEARIAWLILCELVARGILAITGLTSFIGLCLCATGPDRAFRRWALAGVILVLVLIGLRFYLEIRPLELARVFERASSDPLEMCFTALLWLSLGVAAMFHRRVTIVFDNRRLRLAVQALFWSWVGLILFRKGFRSAVVGSPFQMWLHREVDAASPFVIAIYAVGYLVLCRATYRTIENG
jgi:hypothetical protein